MRKSLRLGAYKDLDNLLKVFKYVMDNSFGLGVNLQVLTRFYLEHLLHVKDPSPKEYHRAYMRLSRFFSSLSKNGYVDLKRVDGLVWTKATSRGVDLISYARKTQTRESRRRLHEAKYSAREFVEHKRSLEVRDWELLFSFFEDYVGDVDKRILVFRNELTREFFVKRYTHRFQRKYLRKVRNKFDRIFENASNKYKVGVFLTLTMDPKKYRNLAEATRQASVSWNRFMSRLSKQLGFRPPYIKVLEFQDSGNPHYHVVLFGVESIGDHYELTEYLKKIGFGEIHYEYKIANRGGSWEWANPKHKPTKLHNHGVKDYLKKYVEKMFNYEIGVNSTEARVDDYKISLYFALDSRFFTYSYSLYTAPKTGSHEYGWVFIGSYSVEYLPDWLFEVVDFEALGPPLNELGGVL